MNYFFLRFLPYLYYFIREQYRLDNTAEPPTRRKKYFYRTVITLLIFTLGLTSTVGVVKYRDLYRAYRDTQNQLKKALEQKTLDPKSISRERYEEDIHALSMEKFGWENESRLQNDELIRICKRPPLQCDAQTLHIIDEFKRRHP